MNQEKNLNKLTSEELELYHELLEWKFKKKSFLEFIKTMMPSFEANWHHEIICKRLSQLPYQKSQRLAIAVPAQTGKSEMVSRKYPCWYLGHHPDARIMLISYGTEFAQSFNRANQRTIETPEYAELFPETKLNTKNVKTMSGSPKRTADFFEVVGHEGFLRTVGLSAGSSGYPADILIIDDPYPGMKEALSPTYRESVWNWFTSVGLQRLSKDAHVIILHTRWTDEDLIGTLLRQGKEDPKADKYEYLRFPSIADSDLHPEDPRKLGEPLWPAWKGDIEALSRKRALIGEFLWSAMEQQTPTALGGNLFKAEHWKTYDYRSRPSTFDQIFTSWDCNLVPNEKSDSDYAVGYVIGVKGPDLFILNEYRGRWEFDQTIAMMLKARDVYNPAATVIENKASGAPAVQTLKKKIRGLIPYEPKGSKISRALACIPTAASGNIHWPDNQPWVAQAQAELEQFPKSKHDDRVDALTQAILWIQENEGTRRYKDALLKKGS